METKIRSMRLTVAGKVYYSSSFDPALGTLVRTTVEPVTSYSDVWSPQARKELTAARQKRWNREGFVPQEVYSPVPENLEFKLTEVCGFGCSYCYMSSTTKGKHAPLALLEKVFMDLDMPPYEIAFGGGEPTLHPELPAFLELCRKHGTVPNYTTSGTNLTQEIADATVAHVGGVALTYHRHKGIEWFMKTWQAWREVLPAHKRLNIHVIFNKHFAESLTELMLGFNKAGIANNQLKLVVLAYYPDVGRATTAELPQKLVYNTVAPQLLRAMVEQGIEVAFSEGMLPYFLSHPEIGLNLDMAGPAEGRFSCAIDNMGRVTKSSFDNPKGADSVHKHDMQYLWEFLPRWGDTPSGAACYGCQQATKCAAPHDYHSRWCAHQPHNK